MAICMDPHPPMSAMVTGTYHEYEEFLQQVLPFPLEPSTHVVSNRTGNEGTEREQAFVAVHAVSSGYVVTNQSPLNIWHSNVPEKHHYMTECVIDTICFEMFFIFVCLRYFKDGLR